jgi:hypothetical protein
MGHELHMKVLAEGVEPMPSRVTLLRNHCDEFQVALSLVVAEVVPSCAIVSCRPSILVSDLA